ncbi:dTDP-4-dehydrorhamnose 3,5-epimerase [Gloeobacter kilaueensis]|uniref:dTDP-4-dehydrorhamnose 3,5-epimerase n=1 Tax=Gloeobacter kilaueensis (strain ATCC BAA-2537 / CCAP 1431/1 / ULC 316 / JS1) TaxID=1183438 RepID=U5QG97_GLOK1|nr:dTDP-4-dehydrorhamnose 3,5-epimerase [Gloeobacter kilaueensis]AGY56695.1 dTDP-4-dehydrorhamnose 3,5-epimerase [Gloeobacter kilaueensis JS1]
MQRIETSLPGVCVIEPKVFGDVRGYFYESYHRERFAQLGIGDLFVQDNCSYSLGGVLRGLHYQLRHPQAKLCRVAQGEVFDVAVDIRRGSPTFGQWTGVILSGENKRQIYIPSGFAHGFAVISESAEFVYKCSDFYHPEDEQGIAWNDPQVGIAWPLADPRLSEKDKKYLFLEQTDPALLPVYR